jgi:hypothetical protein
MSTGSFAATGVFCTNGIMAGAKGTGATATGDTGSVVFEAGEARDGGWGGWTAPRGVTDIKRSGTMRPFARRAAAMSPRVL